MFPIGISELIRWLGGQFRFPATFHNSSEFSLPLYARRTLHLVPIRCAYSLRPLVSTENEMRKIAVTVKTLYCL